MNSRSGFLFKLVSVSKSQITIFSCCVQVPRALCHDINTYVIVLDLRLQNFLAEMADVENWEEDDYDEDEDEDWECWDSDVDEHDFTVQCGGLPKAEKK